MKGLRVENLKKQVAHFELRAQFSVGVGERLALVGRSGCGKTTLLRMVAGLEPLETRAGRENGRVFLNDCEITAVPPEARNIGFVFQDQALFPSLTVLENAAFGLRMRGVARSDREKQVQDWLKKVGLSDLASASIEKLSGGERQRIAVVRALVWGPDLLLLDEPFSALDREMRLRLIHDILGLLKERPIPVVLVTHEISDVEILSTRRIDLREESSGAVRVFGG